eukprot:s2392_g4.t2
MLSIQSTSQPSLSIHVMTAAMHCIRRILRSLHGQREENVEVNSQQSPWATEENVEVNSQQSRWAARECGGAVNSQQSLSATEENVEVNSQQSPWAREENVEVNSKQSRWAKGRECGGEFSVLMGKGKEENVQEHRPGTAGAEGHVKRIMSSLKMAAVLIFQQEGTKQLMVISFEVHCEIPPTIALKIYF